MQIDLLGAIFLFIGGILSLVIRAIYNLGKRNGDNSPGKHAIAHRVVVTDSSLGSADFVP